MEIKFTSAGDVKVVGLEGKMDSQGFNMVEKKIVDLIDQGARKILLDFAKLEYINSAGLRILIIAANKIKEVEGELRLCSPNKLVKEIFAISGFEKIFQIFDDRIKALEDF